jgi:3-hydroxyacyl-CoA dehydrogenase
VARTPAEWRTGVKYAFQETKGDNRMPIDEVKKVCVIGAGTMGSRISLICAVHGYDTTVYDVSEEAIQRAPARHKEMAVRMIELGGRSQSEIDAGLTHLTFTTDPEKAAGNADLISESVFEQVELKRKVHAQFDQLCPPHTIFTTNTSSLLVSGIEDAVQRGDKFAAMHFHGGLGSLVDIMRGPRTSDETVEILKRFARSLGEVPMVMKREKGGYLYNTLLGGLLRAAWELVIGGYAEPQDVDRAYMLVTKNAIGPFGMMDAIGLNVIADAGSAMRPEVEEFAPEQRAEMLRPLIEKGELGIKTGKGFYTYPNPSYQQPGFLTGEDS